MRRTPHLLDSLSLTVEEALRCLREDGVIETLSYHVIKNLKASESAQTIRDNAKRIIEQEKWIPALQAQNERYSHSSNVSIFKQVKINLNQSAEFTQLLRDSVQNVIFGSSPDMKGMDALIYSTIQQSLERVLKKRNEKSSEVPPPLKHPKVPISCELPAPKDNNKGKDTKVIEHTLYPIDIAPVIIEKEQEQALPVETSSTPKENSAIPAVPDPIDTTKEVLHEHKITEEKQEDQETTDTTKRPSEGESCETVETPVEHVSSSVEESSDFSDSEDDALLFSSIINAGKASNKPNAKEKKDNDSSVGVKRKVPPRRTSKRLKKVQKRKQLSEPDTTI